MRRLFILIPVAAMLSGCGLFKKKENEAPKERPTSVVGEVTSVHAEQGFVLFRQRGPGQLPEGGILSARSLDGKRAVDLQLSPEKLGRFYTADFSKESEIPRKGDLVVRTKLPDDTQNDTLVTEKTEREVLEVKKVNSSSESEIIDSTASRRSR